MSRNPHATNLRHHKPKRIEDKREAANCHHVWEVCSLDDERPMFMCIRCAEMAFSGV